MGRILKFRHRPLPRSRKKIQKTSRRFIERLLAAVIVVSLIGLFMTIFLDDKIRHGDVTGSGRVRVVDGDTIHIGSKKYRLEGIDAPESKQKCFTQEGNTYLCGITARQELVRLIDRDKVQCRGSEKDRYGRYIATCYVGEKNLNSEMVESGWAVAYRKYSLRYLPEEVSARIRGAGVWQGEFDYPWDWRRSNR